MVYIQINLWCWIDISKIRFFGEINEPAFRYLLGSSGCIQGVLLIGPYARRCLPYKRRASSFKCLLGIREAGL